MLGFVSKFTNRLDAKRRVSIPAQFRAVLARDDFEGLYCVPSMVNNAIDAGGKELMEEVEKYLKGLSAFPEKHKNFNKLLNENSETLKIYADGRVMLTENLKKHADITDEVTFVGQNYKFQMWNPKKFEAHIEGVRKRVHAKRSGTKSHSTSQEEGK